MQCNVCSGAPALGGRNTVNCYGCGLVMCTKLGLFKILVPPDPIAHEEFIDAYHLAPDFVHANNISS